MTCTGPGGPYTGPNPVAVVLPSPGVSSVNVPAGALCIVKETPPAGSWNDPVFSGSGVAVMMGSGWEAKVGPVTASGGVATVANRPKQEHAATGSLTILKKVVNDSTSSPPPNVPVTLSQANNFTQLVGSIPANSACTIAEQAPVVPPDLANRGCRWDTSYPGGQNAAMPNPATALNRTVVNRWSCK